MRSSGRGDVFKDKGFWFEGGNSVYANFGSYASALLVTYTLFFAEGRKGLAWEASDVEVYDGVRF